MHTLTFLVCLLSANQVRAIFFDPFLLEASPTPSPENNASYYRLPDDIIPESYLIVVQPNLVPEDNPPMDGMVVMSFSVKKTTNRIFLHGLDITLDNDTIQVVDKASNKDIDVSVVSYESDREMFNIELAEYLAEGGNYSIQVGYTAALANWMGGFYKQSYELNGVTRYFMASQLQATLARRAFPCMDEPHLKARIQLQVARPDNYTALSNMPLDSTTPWPTEDRLVLDTFKETPPMSTYLVALVVSDLVGFNIPDASPQQTIWCRLDAQDRGEHLFAAEMAPRVLRALEEWTSIPFSLPKLHHIAVPQKGGAMENWGLITYQENYLLVDQNASASERQSVLTVMAHETAHQWFGNLVSPRRWDYTWLSEGFAAYMEHYIAHLVEPAWRVMDQLPGQKTQIVMDADVMPESFPLTQEVGNAAEVLQHFGRITYNKGASIIRMTEHMLGAEVFQSGIRNYLKANAFGSGTPQSLMAFWQEAADEAKLAINISSVLGTYTTTTGYPILSVERDFARGTLSLSQMPFPGSPETNTWSIPVSATWEGNDRQSTRPHVWLPASGMHVMDIDLKIGSDRWLLVNPQQTGYYRVNYDAQNWKLLTQALKNTSGSSPIPSESRSMLLDDAWSLWKAGQNHVDIALNLTEYLSAEQDLLPWRTAQRHLQWLLLQLDGTSTGQKLQDWVVKLMSSWVNSVDFDLPLVDHVSLLSRELALPWACRLGNNACRDRAKETLRAWKLTGTHNVPPSMQNEFWCAAISAGDDEDWEFLRQQLKSTKDGTVQLRLLYGLACSQNATTLSRLITPDSGLVDTSFSMVLATACGTPGRLGVTVALDSLNQHFSTIINKFGSEAATTVTRVIQLRLSSSQDLRKIRELWNQVPVNDTTLNKVMQGAVSEIQRRRRWLQDHEGLIASWLNTKSAPGSSGSGAAQVSDSGAGCILIALLTVICAVDQPHFV